MFHKLAATGVIKNIGEETAMVYNSSSPSLVESGCLVRYRFNLEYEGATTVDQDLHIDDAICEYLMAQEEQWGKEIDEGYVSVSRRVRRVMETDEHYMYVDIENNAPNLISELGHQFYVNLLKIIESATSAKIILKSTYVEMI